MEEETNPNKLRSIFFNFKFRLFLTIFVFLALLLSLALFLLNFSTKSNKSSETKVSVTPSQRTDSKAENKEVLINAPKIIFKKYTNKSTTPLLPPVFNTYTLRTNYTNNDVVSFAQKLGLYTYEASNSNNMLVYNFSDKEKKGILSFNKSSGAFTYESYGILKPIGYNEKWSAMDTAKSFLKEIALYDNTIECANTYRKKDQSSQMTFVECHRDWQKTKIPIVNLGGILSMPENKKIGDLVVGATDNSTPDDLNIIDVRDVSGNSLEKENGKSRPDDFNTVTLGIYKDGRVLSVVSNLRLINQIKITDSARDLITPNEALIALENHKSQFSLTIPSGTGILEWDKAYPSNQVYSDNAVINDMSLVFVEKPSDNIQYDYSPSYLITGTAFLSSGYNVRFTEVIPALKSDNILSYNQEKFNKSKVLAAQTGKPNIQLGTFTPDPTSSLISTPVPSGKPIIPPSEPAPNCDDVGNSAGNIGEITLDVPGYGKMTIVMRNAHTFFLKKTEAEDKSINAARKALYKSVQEQYKINVAKWIRQNNDLSGFITLQSNLTTLDKVKDFFEGTINQVYDNTCQAISMDPNNIREAPYVCYYEDRQRNKTPNALTQEVTDEVSTWTLDALKNTNILDEYAQKPDLFPEITLQTFHYVFILPRAVDEKYFKCILTAYSPIIFLYPVAKSQIFISANAPLTYTDPPINKNIWNITAYPDGTLEQDNIKRSNLYYEYNKNKIKFNEPAEGFVIKTDQWREFIKDLSNKIGLNSKETESLIQEVNNALTNIPKTPFLKISLIDRSELDHELPLIINPSPDNIYRINLFIKALNKKDIISEPKIIRIKRNGFTVVELGAYFEP